jgi:hypothetical protein
MDTDTGSTSWNRAIEIFQFHSYRISSAEKGIEALDWFRKTIAARIDANNSQFCLLSLLLTMALEFSLNIHSRHL